VPWLLPSFAFALGAIIGSFLNVVIHRYPREESIVFPASHCPNCNAPIKAYDNIPILSYVWLRGRCRACHQPFSIRYPLVELANALFYLAIFQRTGLSPLFIIVAAVVSMILVLIYIDAEIQILPDVIDIPGIAIGIGIGALMQLGLGYAPDLMLSQSLIDSIAHASGRARRTASSHSSCIASITRRSAGTMSPTRSATMSPGTRPVTSIVEAWPSRQTVVSW